MGMENVLIIDLDKCFECDNPMDEMHHIIPQVRGGKKTIPLCGKCHGKAHGVKRPNNLSTLIKEGVRKSKERARRLGLPDPYQGRKIGSTQTDEKTLKRHDDIVRLLNDGHTVRYINGITGKSTTTVIKVKKLINNQ